MNPVFDEEQAMKITAGDRDLFRELVQVFGDQKDSLLAQIDKAIKVNDPRALTLAAHSLKGSLLNLGGQAAGEIARQLEALGCEGTIGEASRILDRLKEAVALFEQAVARIWIR
jgi:HPt (histidine-containing phosphotransfer) domain-containing protein